MNCSRVLGTMLLVVAGCALADQSVTIAWDPNPEPDVAGYIIHYGQASRNYPYHTNVGNVTTATIYGLQEGVTYYFAITSTNTSGLESDYSNEITNSIPSLSTRAHGEQRPAPDANLKPPAASGRNPASAGHPPSVGALDSNALPSAPGLNRSGPGLLASLKKHLGGRLTRRRGVFLVAVLLGLTGLILVVSRFLARRSDQIIDEPSSFRRAIWRRCRLPVVLCGCGLMLALAALFWRDVSSAIAAHRTRTEVREPPTDPSRACRYRLEFIGLAVQLYAFDHAGALPTNTLCLAPRLGTPATLVCPADTSNPLLHATDWSTVDAAQSSYEMKFPGTPEGDPGTVIVRCRIHNHILHAKLMSAKVMAAHR